MKARAGPERIEKMQIKGVAAIVTGGASGLGGATAERLARAGAKVTIFDMNAELGKKKAAEIGAHFVAVNVTDEAAVEAGLVGAEGVNGQARILVRCDGQIGRASCEERV